MTRSQRRLSLDRETIRQLTDHALEAARGGRKYSNTTCTSIPATMCTDDSYALSCYASCYPP